MTSDFPTGWSDDDQLLTDLRDATSSEAAPPPAMRDAAIAVFDLQSLDEELELLALTYDSVAHGEVLTRDTAKTLRTMAFESVDAGMRIEVSDRHITGQVWPGGVVVLTLESAAGVSAEVTTDGYGFFTFNRPRPGFIRIRSDLPDRTLSTGWFQL